MLMTLPEYFAYQRSKSDGRVTIVALALTLDQRQIDPTADLHVYADVLTLPNASLALPGRNLVIRARKVVASGGTFDVSAGAPPPPVTPINPPQADAATTPGQAGPAGKAGGATQETRGARGANAGSISVFAGEISGRQTLVARGGKGQTGQGGQRGGHGALGATGRDAIIEPPIQHSRQRDWKITPALPGGRGGHGGPGGEAGRSGDGGDGGTVSVLTRKPGGQLDGRVEGGAAGDPASPGGGGRGGDPGMGGRIATSHQQSSHFQRQIWVLSNQRQGGATRGDDGRAGAAAPAAVAGKPGTVRAGVVSEAGQTLADNAFAVTQQLLTMHQAQLYYLAGQFVEARELYEWVQWVTEAARGQTAGTLGEQAAINRQARALLNQLGQGLDFFGNPVNHVPIVNLDRYQSTLTGLLGLGTQVEGVYQRYDAMLRQQQAQFGDFDTALGQASTTIERYARERETVAGQVSQLRTAVLELDDAQSRQFTVVSRAEATFKTAVEARAHDCSFADLLNLLKTIVSIAKSAHDIVKAVEKIGTLSIDPKDLVDSAGKLVKNVTSIRGDATSIGKAWQGIKVLNPPDAPDTAKLILQQEEFDRAVQPYLDLPEAQAYRAQVHDYISITQSRNAKLLEYTNALVQLTAADATIDQKRLELSRIRGDLASRTDPTLAPFRTFMLRLYEDLRFTCMRLLYRENQAYRYWSLMPSPFAVADNTFAQLNAFHIQLTDQILTRIDTTATPRQPVTFRLRLSAAERPGQFAEFRSLGTISFDVPVGDPEFLGWKQVLLEGFTVEVANAKTASGRVYVQFWHRGRVAVFDPTGGRHDFSHEQVLAVYRYGSGVPADGGNLSGDGRIALSPFATWTLAVPARYNPGLDLSAVDRIDLTLRGFSLPPPALFRRVL